MVAKNARNDEEAHRVNCLCFEGFDFFRDNHGADFGGDAGAGETGEDDGADQGAQFAEHGDADDIGHAIECAIVAEDGGHLQGKDGADAEDDEADDGNAADADAHHLGPEVARSQTAAAFFEECAVDGAGGIAPEEAHSADEFHAADEGSTQGGDGAGDGVDGFMNRVSGFGCRGSGERQSVFFFTRNPRPDTRNPIFISPVLPSHQRR